ncbi:efflux RND transporter periplasmic adaptor subunit [Aureimonas mangrovi]|uniref:efflux RND transporter periplasmic adaptor subunit n=1 Tax=Aureimonas mangrovi TaxID=2758041 RepID=UPI00163D7C94|nr:efflux RND transporter periplasmic adaptor subunit [Aureimonas mangrovi]
MSANRSFGPILAFALLALAACQDSEEAAAPAQGGGTPPPPPVGIVEMQPQALPVTSELPGRIAPTRIAEVRPRVGGIVLERVFEQGTNVEEGDPLFQIDPVTFEVAVEAAQASVARAEAVLTQAQAEADRTQSLVQSRTVSQANLDTAIANQRQAEADLAAARASLRQAEIELEYATIRAPISGRIGRALITEGALVSTTGTEALATIQRLDPVYADIQQPVAELLRLREALADGTLTQIEPDVAQVRLLMDNGDQYRHPGRLLFSEATVDPTSGQVTLRAEFPNPDDSLLPGMYVRVLVEQGIDQAAFAVPNQAVQRDTAGRALLYIVNAENVVESRPVTVARVVGNQSIIDSGVQQGDRVVADGFQKTGPGAPVTPVPWEAPGEAAEQSGMEDGAQAAEPEAGEGQQQPEAAAPEGGEPAAEASNPAEGGAQGDSTPEASGTARAAPVPSAAPREAQAPSETRND